MPFLWLAVPSRPDDSSDRGFLERNAIALLSCAAGGPDKPSSGWLGSHAASRKVRDSGLWNADHVEDSYDPAFLDVVAKPGREQSARLSEITAGVAGGRRQAATGAGC